MRKIISGLLLITLVAPRAHAQVALEAGLNLADLSIKSNDTKIQTKFLKGLVAGFTANIAMGDEQHVYFEPGLFYEMTGCNIYANNQLIGGYTINTITIPLNFEYKTADKCSARFFIGAGLYIASNLSGTYSFPGQGTVPSSGGDLVIGSNPGANLKGIDVGFGANMGYMLKKRWFIRARYQKGIFNLLPGGDAKNSITTSSIGITLGHAFGKCRDGASGGSFGRSSGNHWRGLRKGRYSTHPKPPRYPQ